MALHASGQEPIILFKSPEIHLRICEYEYRLRKTRLARSKSPGIRVQGNDKGMVWLMTSYQ